jgi:hypothetical protein
MSGLWNASEATGSELGEARVARARALAPVIEAAGERSRPSGE